MLGSRISFLRKEQNLTQEQLAKKLNITRSSLSLYELGKRDPDSHTITLFAKYFNVSADYLLGISSNLSNENIDINIGTKIKELRKKLGITQSDLETKLNVVKSTISQYENNINTPDITTLKKIADYFNVSTDYLLGRSNNKKETVNKQCTSQYFNKDEETLLKYYRKLNERNKIKLEVKAEMLLEQQNLEKVNKNTFTYSNKENDDSVILISEDEKEYLDYYRSLSPEEQEQLDKNMQKIIDKAWKDKGSTG